jgi:hypothetical protein
MGQTKRHAFDVSLRLHLSRQVTSGGDVRVLEEKRLIISMPCVDYDVTLSWSRLSSCHRSNPWTISFLRIPRIAATQST